MSWTWLSIRLQDTGHRIWWLWGWFAPSCCLPCVLLLLLLLGVILLFSFLRPATVRVEKLKTSSVSINVLYLKQQPQWCTEKKGGFFSCCYSRRITKLQRKYIFFSYPTFLNICILLKGINNKASSLPMYILFFKECLFSLTAETTRFWIVRGQPTTRLTEEKKK